MYWPIFFVRSRREQSENIYCFKYAISLNCQFWFALFVQTSVVGWIRSTHLWINSICSCVYHQHVNWPLMSTCHCSQKDQYRFKRGHILICFHWSGISKMNFSFELDFWTAARKNLFEHFMVSCEKTELKKCIKAFSAHLTKLKWASVIIMSCLSVVIVDSIITIRL